MKALLFLLTAFSALAQSNMEACSMAARFNGDPNGGSFIPEACQSLVFEKGFHSGSPDKTIFGKKNLLYIPKAGTDTEFNLIAGPQTMLSDIQHIVNVPQEERIYILNRGDDGAASILSFKQDAGGNVAPVRKLMGEEISAATGFITDFEGKKLYVYSEDGSWVKAFNLHADPDGRRPANATKVLGLIKLDRPPMTLGVLGDDLVVATTSEILVYDKSLPEPAAESEGPKQVIHTASLFEGAYELGTDQTKNALRLKNQEGAEITFIKDASGYYASGD